MHSTGISKDSCLCQLQETPHICCFPVLEKGSLAQVPGHQHAVHCPGLPSTHHGLGEELTQAAKPVLLGASSAPWAPAPPGRRRDQPQGSARDSSSGASGQDQMIHCYYSYCLSVPTSPYSPQSLMTQCHIQVVTWSLGVMYQSNNRGKQHSGSKVLPIAL